MSLLEESDVVEGAVVENHEYYRHSLVRFHPTNSGTGSMVSLNVVRPSRENRGALYFTFVPQMSGTQIKDSKKFNFKDRVVVKLGADEVGRLLTVCWGHVEVLGNTDKAGKFWPGLTHKTETRSSSLFLEKTESGLSMKVAIKSNNKDTKTVAFTFYNNSGEVVVLTNYLERVLGVLEPV